MALDAADLEQLGMFIDKKLAGAVQALEQRQAANAAVNREAIVGRPEVAPDAGPEFYVHLANGDVLTSHDSASTHMDVNGEAVTVIGRYQKGV